MSTNPYSTPIEQPAPKPSGDDDWSIQMSGTVAEVSGRLERFFLSQGYRLESGTTSDGVYGTGSDLWRILFGAFAKRYKFLLGVTPNHNGTVCNVFLEKGMSGAMGGAIGYMRMKKELQRVRNEIAAM